jgi:misacylated tRNA(Ala) deacylase
LTEQLYLNDSYIKSFNSRVVTIDLPQHSVVLEKTAFYPGGGGQPCDTGNLQTNTGSSTVLKVKRSGGQIHHVLHPDFELPGTGTEVHGVLDWQDRYQLMRTHTAMHILCGVIFRNYGASVTGGNMEPLKGRMDFEFEHMYRDLVKEIEKSVNDEVLNARQVNSRILPREEAFQIPDLIRTKINLLPESIKEVRVVEIEGLDLQADGGTHVRNTSEVGTIRIANYKSKGRINKRIYLELE